MTTATMPSIQKIAPAVGAMELRETDVPRIKPHEVLVKVRASAICGSDLHLWQWDESIRGKLMKASDSFKHGVISGHEFCGHVAEIGKDPQAVAEMAALFKEIQQ